MEEKQVKKIPVLFKKDNEIITSKSKMTLLGRKVFDAAIYSVRECKDKDGNTIIRSDITGDELREFIGNDSTALYYHVKELFAPTSNRTAASPRPSLLDWKIIVMDDTEEYINGKNIITEASFKNGQMSIIWNNALKDKLLNKVNNFTLLDKNVLSQFKSGYAYQIYQLLKKTIDYETWRMQQKGTAIDKDAKFELKMDIIDLKAFLGVFDANIDPVLFNAVKSNDIVTYDIIDTIRDKELIEDLKEYKNFKRYALEKAKKEINELSDIEMEYKPIKKGRGGKTVGITFIFGYKNEDIVSDNEDVVVEKTPVQEKTIDELEFLDEMRGFMKNPDFQKSKNLKSIAEAAHYDMDLIKTVYKIFESPHTGDISNPTGWMIKGCKEGYEMPKKKTKSNASDSFKQNTYDFNELEKRLVKN